MENRGRKGEREGRGRTSKIDGVCCDGDSREAGWAEAVKDKGGRKEGEEDEQRFMHYAAASFRRGKQIEIRRYITPAGNESPRW